MHEGVGKMSKVYVLGINKFDALDGFMTSEDIKVFSTESACRTWKKKRQAEEGFKFIENQSDSEYWEFIKETLHGNYRHVFWSISGRY